VKQAFTEHFQNLNSKLAKVGNHGPIKLEDLYHERAIILNRFKEQIWKNNRIKMKVLA
jgi:hypothetical protein